MKLRIAAVDDAPILAAIHANCFETAWPAADIAALLASPGAFGLVAEDERPVGFVLIRTIAEAAEVLTLAVDPTRRRSGVARALMSMGLAAAFAREAEAMFLEVAVDNVAAVKLYHSIGFETAGRRPGYYRRARGMIDALMLRRSLNTSGQ